MKLTDWKQNRAMTFILPLSAFKRRTNQKDEGQTEGKEEDIRENEDQTFQDGTLDDGMTPSPEGLRGDISPDWPEPERDHGHVGKTDE